MSPYCDKYGGYVLNATIDRYAYSVITPLPDSKISFSATDLQEYEEFDLTNFPFPISGKLVLHKAVYNYMILNFNNGNPVPLDLRTFCDAPVGSGLGSSSTLVVAMIRAFMELLSVPLDDYAIARLAFQIERIECGYIGGRQDQYAATFGGFNFMEFYENDRAVVNSLRIKNWIICELEASLILFFSGTSRQSAEIIRDQSKNMSENIPKTMEAMDTLKQQAVIMKECLQVGNFAGYVEAMRISWENKKRSANSISSPLIDKIFDSAISSGALAGKVSGAGGGGFMMFFVPTESRLDVIRSLQLFEGGLVSNCHFTKQGTQAWRL